MYCLTCRQIPWRNEVVAKRFKDAGLDVEFFHGVHGASVGVASTLSHFDAFGHLIGPGKLSITISKILLWSICCERPEDEVLIFENDVVFAPDFKAKLAEAIRALPDDWDVVHVGHCCTADKPTRQINPLVAEIKHPFCCHAILWRKRAMRLAIDEFMRASWGSPSDIMLAELVYPKLRHYSLTPGLAFQDATTSEAASTGRWDTIQGWFDFSHLYNEQLDRVTGPATFVEVGSWLGRSTAYFAEEIKRRYKPVTLYAVDTWKGTPGEAAMSPTVTAAGGDLFDTWQKNISRAGVLDYVKPIQAASVDAACQFADGSIDFVFIDGDHSREAVAADLRAWWPKLKPGAIMAGHDIDGPGVRRSVDEFFRGTWRRWENCWISSPKRA